MAIKMVRQPSETPNIKNIDDIVGLRYSYGNQNGYVIAKGNEVSYSVNGSTFTLNSGRLVLQGVEVDIDANGLDLTVDNIATKQYYSIYLIVNLALNTVQIQFTVDTAGYPEIDPGDDLTKNTSGIARLELYRFTAQNGVINDIEKVIKGISYINGDYIKDTKVNNATNADKSTTQPENDNSTNIATTEFVTRACNNVKNIVYGNIGVSTSYTGISVNQVKRQVNFVIGELTFADSNATLHSTNNLLIGKIPEGFRPKATENFVIIIAEWNANGSPRPHKCTIEPDGSIYCSSYWTDGAGGSFVRAYNYSVKFGYEIT